MAKFNNKQDNEKLVENEEGVYAYKKEEREHLVTMVLTSFYNEEKFYGDNSKLLVETCKKVIKHDAKFVANLAIYARKEMNLRSVSHVITCLLASIEEGKKYVKQVCENAVLRADDILEILAFYVNTYGKPIPNSLKKGLAVAMEKFDEYQFAKYTKKGSAFNFRDVLRLTHAKAKTEERNVLYKKIIDDELATPYTWETELSAKGNNAEVWEELIESGKVGYLAMLRNLNNILKVNPSNLDKALEFIANEQNVLNSRVLPFRYYSAYKTLTTNPNFSSKVVNALESAMEISLKNVDKIPGKTLIAVDVSGSMGCRISRKSDVACSDIAAVLGSMANSICEDSIVVTFDNSLKVVHLSNKSGILTNIKSIKFNGGSTYCNLPIEYLNKNKIVVDRIIMLSDNMCNYDFFSEHETNAQKALNTYRKNINSDVIMHAVDLMGYSTKIFKNEKTNNYIAGWSEKLLEYIMLYEKGITSLEKDIAEYVIK